MDGLHFLQEKLVCVVLKIKYRILKVGTCSYVLQCSPRTYFTYQKPLALLFCAPYSPCKRTDCTNFTGLSVFFKFSVLARNYECFFKARAVRASHMRVRVEAWTES